MYYSLTFTYDKPSKPLFFSLDERTYPYSTTQNKGTKNTWIDWHLVPTERPSIDTPEVNTKTVDVPGMNGDLDFSESLTGYPTYKNRKGSIEFMVLTGYESWNEIYNEMCSFFHGRKLYFACEDDPAYYYYGRITVNQYQSQKDNSKITIDYDLEPFKYEYTNGKSGCYWDTFDFESDTIDGIKWTDKFYKFDIDSPNDYVKICKGSEWGNFTEMPVIPTFTVEGLELGGFITIHFVNQEMGIDVEKTMNSNGGFVFPELVITQIQNTGKVRYAVRIIDDNPYKRRPLTYSAMGYTSESMTLEAKGKGKLTINLTTGRK